jgi:hypothetical protein
MRARARKLLAGYTFQTPVFGHDRDNLIAPPQSNSLMHRDNFQSIECCTEGFESFSYPPISENDSNYEMLTRPTLLFDVLIDQGREK